MLAMAAADDGLVRNLLDQRAQRANIPPPHARYSTFSDASDSPSLYSSFSPNHRSTSATPAPRFPHLDDNDFYDQHTTPFICSPAERLADPNASSLDLSEDTYSVRDSCALEEDIDESSINQTDDDETDTRLSLMGPKMRVHSRAPWEEETVSEHDQEDSGMDGMSIFGGKKGGLSVMRGLGFGSKSPAPRPSFESTSTSKDKRSFETNTSGTGSSSHGVLQSVDRQLSSPIFTHPYLLLSSALAQASISSTSLALGPSTSGRLPHKLSASRLTNGRDRAASVASAMSDTRTFPPPMPSPRAAVFSDKLVGRASPTLISMRPPSPSRSEASISTSSRTRSPSPIPPERNGAFIHPYANPALLGAYQHDSMADPRLISRKSAERAQTPINGSVETSAASEETVTLSHLTSMSSTSARSGLGVSTPLTSTFSLVSARSYRDLSPGRAHEIDAESTNLQRRLRRDTKLGPISAPTLVSHGDFPSATPVALISLEQAQAQARERSRGATSPLPSPGGSIPSTSSQTGHSGGFRPRTTSFNTGGTQAGDQPSPISPLSYGANKQIGYVASQGAKVIKPKRSGFMKLFNGKEKEKGQDIQQPPIPSLPVQYGFPPASNEPYPPVGPVQLKATAHRVPAPAFDGSAASLGSVNVGGREESKTKRVPPQLSIKITSPPTATGHTQEPLAFRRSDSSNADSLNVTSPPKIPISAPAGRTQFTSLSVRPVSTFFSSSFADHLLSDGSSLGSSKNTDVSSLISPTSLNSNDSALSPKKGFGAMNVPDSARSFRTTSDGSIGGDDPAAVIASLKEQLQNSSKKWQHRVWELEGQIRDLKAEIDELKSGEKCESCGRGMPKAENTTGVNGVVNRPRAKTGTGARFASGNEV